MATWAGRCLLALMVLTGVSGCGTVLNFQQEEEGPKVFGGVLTDAALGPGLLAAGADNLIHPKEHEKLPPGTTLALGACALADLPFSLVADTLTLPLTIPVALRKVGDGKPPTEAGGGEGKQD
jgi:uncharacterized protein YceK